MNAPSPHLPQTEECARRATGQRESHSVCQACADPKSPKLSPRAHKLTLAEHCYPLPLSVHIRALTRQSHGGLTARLTQASFHEKPTCGGRNREDPCGKPAGQRRERSR